MTRVLTTSAGVESIADTRPEHALKRTKIKEPDVTNDTPVMV